jgi:hypothetical protein
VAKESGRLELELSQALNERELQIAAEDAKSLEAEVSRMEEYFQVLKQAKEVESCCCCCCCCFNSALLL